LTSAETMNKIVTLASREDSGMTSVCNEYLCLTRLPDGRYRLFTGRYEGLAERSQHYNEETEDYDLPDEIDGKVVVGMEDDYVVGGSPECYDDSQVVEFSERDVETATQWLRESGWSAKFPENDLPGKLHRDEQMDQPKNVSGAAPKRPRNGRKKSETLYVLERAAMGSVDWAWIWRIYVDASRPRSLTVIAKHTYWTTDEPSLPIRLKCGRDPDELITAIQSAIEGFEGSEWFNDLESGEIRDIANRLRPIDPLLADGVETIAARWDTE
jgi:hypothetical protein